MSNALFWWTGAVAWSAVFFLVAWLVAFILWRAAYATYTVLRGICQLRFMKLVPWGQYPYGKPRDVWVQNFFRGPRA